MLRRRRHENSRKPPFCRNVQEMVNVFSAGEFETQEARFRSWKDRPKKAVQEMPPEVFDMLQKQHNLEDDS
jgi:hypothetical protein